MFRIRKTFKFEGAHILTSSFSEECRRVHGHSYRVEIIISNRDLNEDGMVIDFKKLSSVVFPLIDDWDHKLLYEAGTHISTKHYAIEGWLAVPFNPTAENMARYLYKEIINRLIYWGQEKISNLTVRIHETDTGYAEYTE